MDQLGADLPLVPLYLIDLDDFELTARWADGDYPDGATLVLHLGDTEYPFTIAGDTATLVIESEVADTIEDGTAFRLRFNEPGAVTERNKVRMHGNVRRVAPR
ncbi:hypothetical protein DW322_21275 [Rhodococcus rhodnii]|uniref:LtfC/p132/Gp6 beta-sandwich domain-containing protein n=2 Tax=Rhodococcus rhodnii TaxID=38312 RepID=R7WPW7_9NOCA|nr:hypothetical protein [Rhodococcus rhodnii]EOM77300.1 hypothetical protein Rrhod_1334 [Rhodococcus rhodnii LMG 5362]TXG88281.1 hypothetical protein DW322_21605 [Rhodococcus rhodnii]TXG88312.1 hypothetical protein DW322_21355 [Rhodococcus rhodnii]TXG89081.1 hypothetical protein DW322_01000 [Rhodococcus rhodnii]TXG92232.1 hypothetical protein DW322_21275 [Rhodococcus rhodnii]